MDWIRPHYLDASVLVKLVVDEVPFEKARDVVQRTSLVVTTTVCVVEALTVLKVKHLYRKELSQEQYFTGRSSRKSSTSQHATSWPTWSMDRSRGSSSTIPILAMTRSSSKPRI